MGNENYLFLMHHGIKGMHWGIRRFQNEDGSLTPAGKERYSETSDSKQFNKTCEKALNDKKMMRDFQDAVKSNSALLEAATDFVKADYNSVDKTKSEFLKAIKNASKDINVKDLRKYDVGYRSEDPSNNGDDYDAGRYITKAAVKDYCIAQAALSVLNLKYPLLELEALHEYEQVD